LDGYSHFPWEYLKIVSTHPQSFLQENVGFICIPWGGYSEGELTDIVLSFHKHIYSCRYVVVVCHECLLGSVFDNGVSSKKGHKLPDIPWVTYWAVGDIHKAQNAGLPNAFYAGAPMQFKFQDVLDKFVLSVDLSDPCNPVQIKIDSKKLITVYSLDAVVEDGRNFYMVKGSDPKELITAHKYNSVIKTNWEESSEAETISLENDDIFIGLYEFLKEKGFSEQEISFARDLVVNLRD
jgi:DNA repair exonuclease SbcCD nuclease subunit